MSGTMKQDLQQQLVAAKAELQSWEQQELTRNDGSQAQDRRFEERRERLQERVGELARQLDEIPD